MLQENWRPKVTKTETAHSVYSSTNEKVEPARTLEIKRRPIKPQKRKNKSQTTNQDSEWYWTMNINARIWRQFSNNFKFLSENFPNENSLPSQSNHMPENTVIFRHENSQNIYLPILRWHSKLKNQHDMALPTRSEELQ